MAGYVRKLLLVSCILIALIVVSVRFISQAAGRLTVGVKTLDRDLDPVIISGATVSDLVDAPVGHLFVYTYTGAGWGGQIPVQVDEVESGSYVTFEDGLLDADDRIVFMAGDVGDQSLATASLLTTLPISATWYEIEVTDPLSPTKKGWAYLVRSGVLTPTFSADYIDYITTTRRITTSQYELGFAATHAGFDHLALNGSGVDILDRTKLRVTFDNVPFVGSFTLTENNLGIPDSVLIKDGPVRVLLGHRIAGGVPGVYQADLDNTIQAYASLLRSTDSLSYTIRGGVVISVIRVSIDLDSVASGATFFNAHTAAGVTIDGTPDAVPETLSAWAQVSHTTGRVIQVSDLAPMGGTLKTFYRDNSTPESNDTGQPGSYGDSGFLIENGNQTFTTHSSLFVLPPADGKNVGDTYQDYSQNPLTVTATAKTGVIVYLPAVFR